MHLGKNKTTKIIKTWISGDRRTTVSGAKCMRKPFLQRFLGQNACRNLFWGLRAVPPLQRRKNDAAIVNLNRACPWPPCNAIGYQSLVVSERRFFLKGRVRHRYSHRYSFASHSVLLSCVFRLSPPKLALLIGHQPLVVFKLRAFPVFGSSVTTLRHDLAMPCARGHHKR